MWEKLGSRYYVVKEKIPWPTKNERTDYQVVSIIMTFFLNVIGQYIN